MKPSILIYTPILFGIIILSILFLTIFRKKIPYFLKASSALLIIGSLIGLGVLFYPFKPSYWVMSTHSGTVTGYGTATSSNGKVYAVTLNNNTKQVFILKNVKASKIDKNQKVTLSCAKVDAKNYNCNIK